MLPSRRLPWRVLPAALLAACGPQAKLSMVDRAMRLQHPRVPTVDVAEARQLVEAGALWVDVRTPEERSVSRIPGALDAEAVEAAPASFHGQVLVAYCTIGVRSADWAAERRADGLDVRNLAGSVMSWARADEDFATPDGTPTRRVHTWSARFDWLPEGYEGVTEPAVPR